MIPTIYPGRVHHGHPKFGKECNQFCQGEPNSVIRIPEHHEQLFNHCLYIVPPTKTMQHNDKKTWEIRHQQKKLENDPQTPNRTYIQCFTQGSFVTRITWPMLGLNNTKLHMQSTSFERPDQSNRSFCATLFNRSPRNIKLCNKC